MCIAYLAIQADSDWPLFIAANRDEFHRRAARPAAPWPDAPQIIAGVDQSSQGTWLGVTRDGRFGLVTNYRDPTSLQLNKPSRGALVTHFLRTGDSPSHYAHHVAQTGQDYNGFNLIVGDLKQAFYVANRALPICAAPVAPGRHVISNHLLNSPWPNAERLRMALDALPLNRLEQSLNDVFAILKDETRADDQALPSTGIPLERERLLSSPFIVSPDYGTRCSTVVAVHASGRGLFSEISYTARGERSERHDWPFQIE